MSFCPRCRQTGDGIGNRECDSCFDITIKEWSALIGKQWQPVSQRPTDADIIETVLSQPA